MKSSAGWAGGTRNIDAALEDFGKLPVKERHFWAWLIEKIAEHLAQPQWSGVTARAYGLWHIYSRSQDEPQRDQAWRDLQALYKCGMQPRPA